MMSAEKQQAKNGSDCQVQGQRAVIGTNERWAGCMGPERRADL